MKDSAGLSSSSRDSARFGRVFAMQDAPLLSPYFEQDHASELASRERANQRSDARYAPSHPLAALLTPVRCTDSTRQPGLRECR